MISDGITSSPSVVLHHNTDTSKLIVNTLSLHKLLPPLVQCSLLTLAAPTLLLLPLIPDVR